MDQLESNTVASDQIKKGLYSLKNLRLSRYRNFYRVPHDHIGGGDLTL